MMNKPVCPILGAGAGVGTELANTCFHIAHQHRSTLTFEMDLRAHSDLAWWNRAGNPDLK